MRDRIGDFSKPWVCPPSLVKVFANRHARQEARAAKARAVRETKRPREPELSDEAFYEAVRAAAKK